MALDWAPANYNFGMPYAWQPNFQYPSPTPSTFSGSGSHISSQNPVNNLVQVSGPESAKSYQMPPKSSVVMFHSDEPIFYLKTTDDSGFATLRTFEFSEKKDESKVIEGTVVEGAPTVSKDDLDILEKKIESFGSDLASVKSMLEGLVS